MAIYIVEIPIAGSISFDVEADSKKEALERAWEMIDQEHPDAVAAAEEVTWEYHEKLAEGNVLHASPSEQSATLRD